MATVTPGRTPGTPVSKTPRTTTKTSRSAAKTDISPSPSRNLRLWLQAVLDRPLTSYHLVLGSSRSWSRWA